MSNIALSELRAQARELADMVGSTFISDAQVDKWINRGIAEFYDLLVEYRRHEYFVAEASIIITAGVAEYELPVDFYQLLRAQAVIDTRVHDMAAFDWGEFSVLSDMTQQGVKEFLPPKYRLRGSLDVAGSPANPEKIYVAPDLGRQWQLWIVYIPKAPQLAADSDVLNTINYWDEYVIAYAAERMLLKEESDPSGVRALRAEITERIKARAPTRSADAPKVLRVRGRDNHRRGGL